VRRLNAAQVMMLWRASQWPLYVSNSKEQPINVAQARNMAAHFAEPWEVAIFADACVVPDMDAVAKAVEMAAEHKALVHAHERTLYLAKDGQVARAVEHPIGGVVVVHRSLFDAVHGYDEHFHGWGGEDNAFAWACGTLGMRLRGEGVGRHLWHARMPRAEMWVRLGRYRAALGDPDAMRALVAE